MTGNERERTNETMAAGRPSDMGPEIVWMVFSTTPHEDTYFISLLGFLAIAKTRGRFPDNNLAFKMLLIQFLKHSYCDSVVISISYEFIHFNK